MKYSGYVGGDEFGGRNWIPAEALLDEAAVLLGGLVFFRRATVRAWATPAAHNLVNSEL